MAHPRGEGDHALDFRALLGARVVAAHARAQGRGRPDVERIARGINEVIDAGGSRQRRNEVGGGWPARGGCVAERDQVFDVGGPRRGQESDEAEQDLGRGARVPSRTVLRSGRRAEIRGDRAQLVIAHERARQGQAGQRQRVHDAHARPGTLAGARGAAQETHVEGGIVRDEHRRLLALKTGPLDEALQDRADRVGVLDHRGRDARQRRDKRRDRLERANQRRKLVGNAPASHPNRTDLRDLSACPQARRLQVDNHPVPARGRGADSIQAQLQFGSRTTRQCVRNELASIAFVRLHGRDAFRTIAHVSLFRHRVDTNSNARPRAR